MARSLIASTLFASLLACNEGQVPVVPEAQNVYGSINADQSVEVGAGKEVSNADAAQYTNQESGNAVESFVAEDSIISGGGGIASPSEAAPLPQEPSPGSSPQEPVAESPPDSSSTTPASEPPAPVVSFAPINILSGSLQCNYSSQHVAALCSVKDASGNSMSFAAKKGYIISGNPIEWTEKNLVWHNSQWMVTVPQGLAGSSYAVALRDDQDQVVVGWVLGSSAPSNVLVDGSFESYSVPSNYTSYIAVNEQGAWKTKGKADSLCENPPLEIQANGTSYLGSAADGKQWVELDSICFGQYTGGNAIVYQVFQAKQGHYYSLAFSYRKRNTSSYQKFRFAMGTEVLLDQQTTNTEWKSFQAVRKADANSWTISFEELGTSDGVGTLIDYVTVYELGQGPEIK